MNAIPALALVRLPLGAIVATPGALAALADQAKAVLPPLPDTPSANERAIRERVAGLEAQEAAKRLIRRHAAGDWGDLEADDKAANDAALKSGDARILSAYALTGDDAARLWIITEADRSCTTLLLPSEY